MKYMHFKSSCSYTALAAILEEQGVDTEDTQIALEIKLPWLFARDGDTFLAGPMLQGAKWFDLWLAPRGLRMREDSYSRESLCRHLQTHSPVMLGLQTPLGKHAVVFRHYDGRYHFFNPTHPGSEAETALVLTGEELFGRTDQETVVGEVVPGELKKPNLSPLLAASVAVLWENLAEIEAFSAQRQEPEAWAEAMNRLFRPLLLDGISMLELAGQAALARAFTELQAAFLGFLRGPRTAPLCETLSLPGLRALTEDYIRLIRREIEQIA